MRYSSAPGRTSSPVRSDRGTRTPEPVRSPPKLPRSGGTRVEQAQHESLTLYASSRGLPVKGDYFASLQTPSLGHSQTQGVGDAAGRGLPAVPPTASYTVVSFSAAFFESLIRPWLSIPRH